MEKIGLVSKLTSNLNLGWESYQDVQTSVETQNHNAILQDTLGLLKAIKATKDTPLALGVEEMMLRQELTLYANSPEETNSIKKALEQLQEARKSFAVVHNHEVYQQATETYSSKQKEAGLPLDSCRQFLKSHSVRLTNRMASPLSVPEKNILRQRKELLGMVKEVYMGLQKEALGLNAPLKNLSIVGRKL